LAPRHIKDLESCVPRQECREKGYAKKERPWLDALKRLEEGTTEEEKRRTNTALSSKGEISEPLVQRGAKSDRSPTPAPYGEETCRVGSHQQVRRAAQLLGVDLPDTKDETLALYANEHKFICALRNYRKASKLASTYGASWLDNGYHKDGRIYASWRQLRAATRRMACDHPNLQNIPRRGSLRTYIRAPEGWRSSPYRLRLWSRSYQVSVLGYLVRHSTATRRGSCYRNSVK
jgi:DNA polymerase family A